jgi:hypothetical protein
VIQCRQENLDASDRLLSKMTPEGRVGLERWVMEARSGVSAVVHEENLKYFRPPR